ncbi:MAG: copper amine oxidase N-terminal domain-containing protein [Firmicutes bacterium]|nr:copper amine oxidase N-terminal domain-containing protein [Bacillota bacterium]
MRKTMIVITMLVCVMFLGSVSYAAQSFPQGPPAVYEGTVKTSNGESIKSGTIKAYVENELKAEKEFTDGLYINFTVQCDQSDLNKPVTFKVTIDEKDYQAVSDPNSVSWTPGAVSDGESVPYVNLTVDYSGDAVVDDQDESNDQSAGGRGDNNSEDNNSASDETVVEKVIKLTIGKVEGSVDDSPYTLDSEPYINTEAQRTMVPLRFVSEGLGAEVEWMAETRQVVIKDSKTITLTIDSVEALIDGTNVTMDSAPVLEETGRTFVPLRFVSETLGAQVDYDGAIKGITITR